MEQNGFDIVVLLTLIINFGLVLCSSCFGALCGCYHLYMLFISFILMILVHTKSAQNQVTANLGCLGKLVVRSDGLFAEATKQVLSNQHECHLFPPGSPRTNMNQPSCFRVFVFSPGSHLPS